MPNKQKISLMFVLTLCFVFFVFVPKVFAVDWNWLNPMFLIAQIFDNVILRILSLVLALGGFLFDWVLGITKFTDIPAVQAGWSIIRDFVNISFIFILLVIAISTILGVEKFGMKQLFAKLIIVALLVNFSMLMCNIIIDTTNLITHFFIEGASLSGIGVSSRIMAGLGVAKIYQASTTGAKIGASLGGMIIPMILSATVMIGAVIAIWLAVGMLIVRILVLSFLIILAPAAFLCRVLPNTQDLWAKWWKTFINYCLFAPAFAFFLYLALLTAQKSTESVGITSNAPYAGLPQAGNSFFSAGDTLIHYILFLGLILGGLMMAKHFGIAGGAKVYAWGTGAMKKVSGYNFAQRKGMETWGAVKEKAKTYAKSRQAALLGAEKLQGLPVIGRFAKRAQIDALAKEREGNKAIVSKYDKFLPEEIGKIWNQLSKREQAVLLEDIAKKKKVHKMNLKDPVLQATIQNMPKYQTDYKEVFKYSPAFALEAPNYYDDPNDPERKNKKAIDDIVKEANKTLFNTYTNAGVNPYQANQLVSDKHNVEKIATMEFAFSKMTASDITGMKGKALDDETTKMAFIEALKNNKLDARHIRSIMSSDNSDLIKSVTDTMNKNVNLDDMPEQLKNYWKNSVMQGLAGMAAAQQPTPTPTPAPAPAAPAGTP